MWRAGATIILVSKRELDCFTDEETAPDAGFGAFELLFGFAEPKGGDAAAESNGDLVCFGNVVDEDIGFDGFSALLPCKTLK